MPSRGSDDESSSRGPDRSLWRASVLTFLEISTEKPVNSRNQPIYKFVHPRSEDQIRLWLDERAFLFQKLWRTSLTRASSEPLGKALISSHPNASGEEIRKGRRGPRNFVSSSFYHTPLNSQFSISSLSSLSQQVLSQPGFSDWYLRGLAWIKGIV